MVEPNLSLREAVFMFIYRNDYGITLQDIEYKTGISEKELCVELLRLQIPIPTELGKKYPQDSLDMAVYLYENRQTNGLKVVDIIERTGLHRNALYRELEIRGIETTRAFSTDNIELAIELFLNRKENGYRLKDIKDKTGISKTTLYRELENRGIEFNNGNRKVSEEVRYKALSLYFERETNKLTVRDIIMKTGVTRAMLYGDINKLKTEQEKNK